MIQTCRCGVELHNIWWDNASGRTVCTACFGAPRGYVEQQFRLLPTLTDEAEAARLLRVRL